MNTNRARPRACCAAVRGTYNARDFVLSSNRGDFSDPDGRRVDVGFRAVVEAGSGR